MTQKELLTLCQKGARQLKTPIEIDPVKLLWALAGNESLFGVNLGPLHESNYCYGGKYFTKEVARLTHLCGCLAHCSYGPWQLLYINATLTYETPDPVELYLDPEYALKATVQFIQKRIFDSQGAKTLRDVADSYNSGNFRDSIIPTVYIEKFLRNYALVEETFTSLT